MWKHLLNLPGVVFITVDTSILNRTILTEYILRSMSTFRYLYSVYLSLWEVKFLGVYFEGLQPIIASIFSLHRWRWDKVLYHLMCAHLVLIIISVSYSTHLTLYRDLLTLHDIFMDPLYIVSRHFVIVELLTLFSVLLVFLSDQKRLIILYLILSLFKFGFMCMWCFCAVKSLYVANNAFIFSISLVIKKFFMQFISWVNLLCCFTSLENHFFWLYQLLQIKCHWFF